MEAMIQSINSCTISPASQTAESLLQPAQSFKETLRKQSGAKDQGQRAEDSLHPAESPKPVHQKQKPSVVEENNKDQGQRAESGLQPAASFDEVLQKQPVAEQENKDPEPGKVAAALLSNLLPVLPNLGGLNNLEKVNLSEAQPPGQPVSPNARVMQNQQAPFIVSLPETMENPEENILPFPTAQAKADASAAATASFSEVINELPEGQKKSLFVMGTTLQHAPWAMRNEGIREALPKSEFDGNLLGQKITLPGFSTDSPMLLAFDEKLDILLGQNSTGGEVPGRSWNGEFIGLENSSAEKNSPKGISGGENHPTQDPFGVNELLGGLKTATVVEETGTPQKPTLSRTEHPDPYQQIAEKVIWSIRNNQERIQLTLEPPQLGNLFIELHRNKDEIKATLWVDNPKTKDILENNQFQLQKTLEGHGYKLEQYDVFVQNEMGSFQGKEESPVFQGQGSPTQSLQIEEAELPASLEIPAGAIPASGGSQYIDRFI